MDGQGSCYNYWTELRERCYSDCRFELSSISSVCEHCPAQKQAQKEPFLRTAKLPGSEMIIIRRGEKVQL